MILIWEHIITFGDEVSVLGSLPYIIIKWIARSSTFGRAGKVSVRVILLSDRSSHAESRSKVVWLFFLVSLHATHFYFKLTVD